jgi:hypothetical protein
VIFLIDGKPSFTEEYSDIQTDIALDAKLFNTENWMTVDRKYFLKK